MIKLLVILVNAQVKKTTYGYEYTQIANGFSNSQGQYIYIGDSCRKLEFGDLELNSKVDSKEYYFLVNLTCNDIVDDEKFFNQERDSGDSTILSLANAKNIQNYQCTLNVTFDNSQHCCCPERKNGFQFKILN